MKSVVVGAVFAGVMSVSAAQASVLDFSTSPAFDSTFVAVNTTDVTTVTVDGVQFTVTALDSRGAEGFRQNTVDGGLRFGTPGNGMYEMKLSADKDIILNSLYGFDDSVTTNEGDNGPLVFDATFSLSTVASDFAFLAMGSSVDLGDTLLTSGSELFLSVDYDQTFGFETLIGATIQTLTFEQLAPVPLPAGMPLLLAGVGAFGWMKRRKAA